MKLLVVDDSMVARRMLIRALRQEGLVIEEVKEAGDGLEALVAVATFVPDLVISDLSMPKLDGKKLLVALRQKFTRDRVRIIILTAKATPATEAQMIELGADAFLSKPFEPIPLLGTIRQVMAGK